PPPLPAVAAVPPPLPPALPALAPDLRRRSPARSRFLTAWMLGIWGLGTLALVGVVALLIAASKPAPPSKPPPPSAREPKLVPTAGVNLRGGDSLPLEVFIDRGDCRDRLLVQVEKLPPHVTGSEAVVEPEDTFAVLTLRAGLQAETAVGEAVVSLW